MKKSGKSKGALKSKIPAQREKALAAQAEAKIEQGKAREEQAKAREEQAKAREEQAKAQTERANARAEKADFRAEEAEKTLRKVLRKDAVLTPENSPRLLKPPLANESGVQKNSLEQLTERQREILRLIAEGQNTKQIAELLGVSPKTVEYHRMKLMAGLNLHDIPGLVRFAVKAGLITPDN